MAIRSKAHYNDIHELITFKEMLSNNPYANISMICKKTLQDIYQYELDSFYFRVINLSKDCRQWLEAASKFKAAGDLIGYDSCLENYKHYHGRKIQLTNKQPFL